MSKDNRVSYISLAERFSGKLPESVKRHVRSTHGDGDYQVVKTDESQSRGRVWGFHKVRRGLTPEERKRGESPRMYELRRKRK